MSQRESDFTKLEILLRQSLDLADGMGLNVVALRISEALDQLDSHHSMSSGNGTTARD